MPYRYTGRKVLRNDAETYDGLVADRGLSHIDHYKTPRLRHPTVSERQNLTRIRHVWKLGDRYWKLASENYGNAKYWWVIAWYNQKPTEASLELGDTLLIPRPLDKVLEMAGY